MAEMFYDDDADLSISGRSPSSATARRGTRALSLRDSGVDVRVGLAEGSKSRAKAEAQGLKVMSVADCTPPRRPTSS